MHHNVAATNVQIESAIPAGTLENSLYAILGPIILCKVRAVPSGTIP